MDFSDFIWKSFHKRTFAQADMDYFKISKNLWQLPEHLIENAINYLDCEIDDIEYKDNEKNNLEKEYWGMEKIVHSTFTGTVNGVVFNDQVEFEQVSEVVELMEEKYNLGISNFTFTNDLKAYLNNDVAIYESTINSILEADNLDDINFNYGEYTGFLKNENYFSELDFKIKSDFYHLRNPEIFKEVYNNLSKNYNVVVESDAVGSTIFKINDEINTDPRLEYDRYEQAINVNTLELYKKLDGNVVDTIELDVDFLKITSTQDEIGLVNGKQVEVWHRARIEFDGYQALKTDEIIAKKDLYDKTLQEDGDRLIVNEDIQNEVTKVSKDVDFKMEVGM